MCYAKERWILMQMVGSKKCILNVNSYNFLDCTPRKRGRPKKAAVSLQDRYPAISYSTVDPDEEKTASDSLQKEMQNRKPRRQVFLPLMITTFAARRHFILHDATSVHDILKDYPALKMSSAVSCKYLASPMFHYYVSTD